ncbi:MAG: enoyl-CoA hydratase-related protein, partial [Candidatus Acidiferrales bacterium]
MRVQNREAKAGNAAVAGHVGPLPPKPEEFKFVQFVVEGSVARLTLNRPEHNMLNERMLAELAAGIDSLDGLPDVKLIVLDSATQSFCGGIELGEYTPRRAFQALDALQRTFTVMLDTAKPLLVIVN